jgi:mannose-1-phosphate guanylyltransferase
LGGTRIHFHREKELMGKAGSVKRVSDTAGFDEAFVAIMGDALTDVDLRRLVAFHERKGAAATLALVRVEDTSGYGVVELYPGRSPGVWSAGLSA